MSIDMAWVVELTAIDESTVTFDSQRHSAKVSLPRGDWESMGRPGMVEFSPKMWSPNV